MKYLTFLPVLMVLLSASCDKQVPPGNTDSNPAFRILFYNTENLFDTVDDPLVDDAEFLPGSEKKWTEERYRTKLGQIARVLSDAGGDTLPVLAGFCEVENRKTMEDLIATNPLKNAGYRIVHRESPDRRGIDVALIYRSRYFQLLDYAFMPMRFPFDTAVRTRDVLYARGVLLGIDTLHVFVNHWPSRSGGEVESRPLRVAAATAVRLKVDSVFSANPQARIVITGDFNDEPMDLSVTGGLRALLSYDHPGPGNLYEITPEVKKQSPGGTYKYKGVWNLLDHMVVSGSLLDTTRQMYTRVSDIHVLHMDYLLENDTENLGVRPRRTYLGNYYQGGSSDHLPVCLDIRVRQRP